MRAPIILLALMLGLSACGRDSDPVNNVLEQALPNTTEMTEPPGNRVTATDPGANESVAADRADTVPVALQGRWTGASDGCADVGAELELQVTPTRLIFHESVGTITRVIRQGEDRVAVEAAFTGEGESWTKRLEMRGSADGRQLTVANDGQAVVRKRCDAAA
jgi:hypothetical protein